MNSVFHGWIGGNLPPLAPSIPSGSMFTYDPAKPRRVRKAHSYYNLPWIVSNHPAGPLCFPTWREAMDYATESHALMNELGLPQWMKKPAGVY